MKDPTIWYTLNAQLDGVDTGSDTPHDRLKLLVYQRRMILAAMRDQAMLLAAVEGGGEKAQTLLKEYLSLQTPIDPEIKRLRDYRWEKTLDELEGMEPISLGSFRFGMPLGPEDLERG